MSFLYLAAPQGGGLPRVGVRSCRSRGALAEELRRERLALRGAVGLPGWAESRPTLSLRDQAILNEQLGQLLARGVPLTEALEVAGNTVTGPAHGVIESIRRNVAAGQAFSEACRRSGVFDEVTIAIYRAAERTGDLAGSARQLAVTARRLLATRGRAATLMIYPAIVLTISFFIAVGMITFIVPMIGTSLSEVGEGRINFFTRGLMNLGLFIQAWFLPLAGLFAAAVGAAVIFRSVIGRWLSSVLARLPMVREVVLAQELARFFATMAAMTRSGVPLADALSTANQAITEPRLRAQMDRLRHRLVEGGVLRQLIEQVDALPPATRKLLIAAERAGDLEQAFNALAGDMTEEVERRSQRLMAVLQPAIIVVMFLIIGSVLMAIIIPMLTIPAGFTR